MIGKGQCIIFRGEDLMVSFMEYIYLRFDNEKM